MTDTSAQPLWQPDEARKAAANMTRLISRAQDVSGQEIADYDDLWRWSVGDMEGFWSLVWDDLGIRGEKGAQAFQPAEKMPDARFFPDARLNYARNVLSRCDDAPAIIYQAEDTLQRTLSWADLCDLTSRIQQVLTDHGIGKGDRIAAYISNCPEAIALLLAASGLGAVISTASPDFGVQGVLDRFGQLEAKLLIGTDAYVYNGKRIDCRGRVEEIADALGCPVLMQVFDPGLRDELPFPALQDVCAGKTPGQLIFEPLPFDHPLYILFSSGTTGAPKCMVHRAGGNLLQLKKEHVYHCDIKRDDRVFFFTTTGWMMWNWLAAVLASEATVMLYDGSPTARPDILFDFIDRHDVTLFGTSAKFIDAIAKAGLRPRESHDLSSLKAMASTGSALVPEGFDYVFEHIKPDMHFASVSGGTDLCGCFVGANPLGPVHRGELQVPVLGMAMDCFGPEGQPVRGEKGELVCTKPFPSMPLTFLGADGDARYRAAYFEGFDNIWTHGDFVSVSPETGGYTFFGRSDATLNPNGVRIGTSEIYRQVEKLPEIAEAIVVGQDWQNDTRVVLFVRLAEGVLLDEALITRIRSQVREGASPRHVPAKVLEVADIPRTKSGKIVELAVREVIHGRPVKNVEALANPEALELFRGRTELES